MIATASALGVPEWFNAAAHFVDRHIAEGRGEKVAIECGGESITYAEIAENVNRFGSALRGRLDVRPEERVLLLLLDGPAFAYAFFGAIKAGAVPVPLNTLWRSADYEYVVRDTRARVLVVSADLLPQIERMESSVRQQLRHVIVAVEREASAERNKTVEREPSAERNKTVEREASAERNKTVEREASAERHSFADLLRSGDSELEPEPTHRDAPAFWLYSSGSTGMPKGCVHLQHDMVVCAELFGKQILGITEHDRTFSVAKLFFAYGLGNALYFPFAVAATTILWPGAPTAANVYGVIERHRPTLFYSVPTGYGMMLAHLRDRGDFDLSSVRLAVSAGEALPPALYERFRARFGVDIIDGIGSTEALHMFISNRPGAIRPGSSGQIVPGYAARILSDSGVDVPDGEVGNLWVRGDSTCAGYWNQHEKTKDTIDGHWLRTGDKYTRDADGYYWYAGRSDDMLKVGGLWVSPIEVENALVGHPAVLECGVIGREDHDGLTKPMAFVVLKAGEAPSIELAAALQQFVRQQLAEYKRPRWVEFLPELPKTATGKIQRFRLRQRV